MNKVREIIGPESKVPLTVQPTNANAFPAGKFDENKPLLEQMAYGLNTRNFRELFLYEFINSIDEEVPDGAKGQEGYTLTHMTLGQKRRLRNQIFRDATLAVEQHNEKVIAKAIANAGDRVNLTEVRAAALKQDGWSVDDPKHLIAAFFNSEFGSQYASLRPSWRSNGTKVKDTVNRIFGWSGFDGFGGFNVMAVSPYDPKLAESDLFSESAEGFDGVVYCKGFAKANELAFTIPADSRVPLNDGRLTADSRVVELVTQPAKNGESPKSDIIIKGGYKAKTRHIIEPTPENLANIIQENKDDVVSFDSELSLSGFTAINRFIKSRKDRESVQKYFEDFYAKNGPANVEQVKFMKELCDYLVSTGRSFNVEMCYDGHPIAKLDDGIQIRLFDPEEPNYQGRIYDSGTVTYLGVSTGNLKYDWVDRIKSSDKMNMVRWYFGESPVMRNENKDLKKGLRIGRYFEGMDSATRNKRASSVYYDATKKSGITIAAIKSEFVGNGSKFGKIDDVYLTAYRGTAGPVNNTQEKTFTVYELTDRNFISILKNHREELEFYLPEDKRYPEYPQDLLADLVDPERVKYYIHLQARERLNEWVESAKTNFRDLVNIEDVIAKSIEYMDSEDYEYPFSSDSKVAQVQKLYFKAARGKVPELTGDFKWSYRTSEESKAEQTENITHILLQQYDAFVEKEFGSVPEIIRDDLPVQQNDAKGFNAENVARYSTAPGVAGMQANYNSIRHMIMKLEDDYTPDFIDKSTYMGAEIHNGSMSFDEKRKIPNATLKGGLFIQNNRIVTENPKEDISGLDDKPVTKEMMFYVMESLYNSGCPAQSIKVEVDEQGIISYSGVVPMGAKTKFSVDSAGEVIDGSGHKISGQIGRVFEPDEYGAIHLGQIGSITSFDEEDGSVISDDEENGVKASSKVIFPGYDAYLTPIDPDNPRPMSERLRLVDWKTKMKQEIAKCVKESIFTDKSIYDFTRHTSDLNVVYKRSYSTAFKEDEFQSWLPKDPEHPTSEEITRLNVMKTLSSRCRFPNEYGDGATTMAQSMLEHPNRSEAKMYDYYYSDLCNNENLRVLGEFFDGIFDKDMTGTAKTQGIVRYLVDGATVDSTTGRVTPSSKPDDACALMKDDLFKFKDFDTWDRRLMSSTQVLTSLHTPRNVGVAMMNVDGWTFDDGFLISKKFAEKYAIDDAHNPGHKRALKTQDKLSDLHGNKGVISKVIDPDFCSISIRNNMSVVGNKNLNARDVNEAQVIFMGKTYNVSFMKDVYNPKKDYVADAIAQIQKQNGYENMDSVLTLFYENPNLDVVAAPYSGMSRFNGGSVRQLQQDSQPLVVNGETIPGGMGYTDLIVVDMPVDVKTHFYQEKDINEGKGRKASAQLAWALQSKGCDAIMREFYGQNQAAVDNLREYAIALGLDFDAEMKPRIGYKPQAHRLERRAIVTPEFDGDIEYTMAGNLSAKTNRDIRDKSLSVLSESGGVLELPFRLKFNTLDYVKGMPKDFDEDAMLIPHVTEDTYGLPMLPAALRSGMEFQDGSPKAHDYTVHYTNIYKDAILYNDAKKHLDELEQIKNLTPEQKKDFESYTKRLKEAEEDAQSNLDKITTDIIDRKFNTKHNVVRDDIMSSRLDHSATAVWSADPRLDLNEVSMSFEHAKNLGLYKLKPGVSAFLLDENGEPVKDANGYVENPNLTRDDYESVDNPPAVLVWRDPILHDSNARYLNVKIDDTIEGVCINPLIDKPFDGDFDGDSVAIVALQTNAAKQQAFTSFSMNSNLLNYGVKNEDGTYPLYIQDGLDVASNCYANPKLKEQYKAIEAKVNAVEKIAREYEANPEKFNGVTMPYDGHPGKGVQQVNVKYYISLMRKDCLSELNRWSHKALSGIGTDHIVVKDDKTIIQSCQHIVDTGAKGSQSKMADFADNMGIHYELGEDGKADINTVERIVDKHGNPESRAKHEGASRDVDKKIQETTAYKADNTSIGGTTSINGVTACRDKDIHAVLELTYPITQAILQSKHDPKDAKVKDEITRFWGKDIWDGYKLTGDWSLTDPAEIQAQTHDRIRIPIVDGVSDEKREAIISAYKRGGMDAISISDKSYLSRDKDGGVQYTYEKCTPEEWKAQMKGMMTALKVDVNPDYIDRLAEIMERQTESSIKGLNGYDVYNSQTKKKVMGNKGTVAGFSEYAAEQGTLLDKMAYSDKLSAMVKEALDGPKARSLFSNAITNGVKIAETELKSRASKDKEEVKQLRAETSALRTKKQNSAMFAPNVFVEQIMHDEQRRVSNPHRDFNLILKRKGTAMEWKQAMPRAIGRRDSFLTADEYDEGKRYFGESKEDYKTRLDRYELILESKAEKAAKEAQSVEVERAVMPETSEPTVSEEKTSTKKVTSSSREDIDVPDSKGGRDGRGGLGE